MKRDEWPHNAAISILAGFEFLQLQVHTNTSVADLLARPGMGRSSFASCLAPPSHSLLTFGAVNRERRRHWVGSVVPRTREANTVIAASCGNRPVIAQIPYRHIAAALARCSVPEVGDRLSVCKGPRQVPVRQCRGPCVLDGDCCLESARPRVRDRIRNVATRTASARLRCDRCLCRWRGGACSIHGLDPVVVRGRRRAPAIRVTCRRNVACDQVARRRPEAACGAAIHVVAGDTAIGRRRVCSPAQVDRAR